MNKKQLLNAKTIRSNNFELSPDKKQSDADEDSSTLSQEKESFPPHDDNTNEGLTFQQTLDQASNDVHVIDSDQESGASTARSSCSGSSLDSNISSASSLAVAFPKCHESNKRMYTNFESTGKTHKYKW
jgi:hypothetical protein